MFSKAQALIRKAKRRTWMKYALRGVGANDNATRLDLAYNLEDPWNMNSPLEQARFAATNRIIEREFGRVGSVLELGCGEGHQSAFLSQVAGNVYGVDVSPQAVERAQKRVPQGQFAAGDIFAQPWGGDRHRFDLVTAFEVLYYIKDVDATIERMRHLGRHGFVTIFSAAARRVGDSILAIPNVQRDWFHHGSTVWLAAWWKND